MRMYLSSFRLGNKPEALQELVGADRRAAIVMNALDNFPTSALNGSTLRVTR